jgi:hypothetical protein
MPNKNKVNKSGITEEKKDITEEKIKSKGKKNVKQEEPIKKEESIKQEVKPEGKAKPEKKVKQIKEKVNNEDKPTKKLTKKVVKDNEDNDDEDPVDANGKNIRSFKVKLPESEKYEGRFTGLTPYQAANKALSKFFRESNKPDAEITFSICESTRKSKKSTYTYVGKRVQLEIPVKYKIQDGREIVKNFKNTLKKVKKSDLAK